MGRRKRIGDEREYQKQYRRAKRLKAQGVLIYPEKEITYIPRKEYEQGILNSMTGAVRNGDRKTD